MKKILIPKNFQPEEFLRQANEAREKDQHLKALENIELAIVGYQARENYSKLAEALQSRCLIYKHLFFLTQDEAFAILAKHDAQASLEISQAHHLEDKLASSHFRLGEAAALFKDYSEAAASFQKAVEKYPGEGAEKGDFRYHWGEALYRIGQKQTGKKIMLEGLKEIQANADQRDSFLIHVWESGCLIKLAELLKNDEPEAAKDYLQKAKKIISSDKRLVIRKRQLEELSKTFA